MCGPYFRPELKPKDKTSIYPPPIAMPETVKVGAGWEAASWGTQVLRPIINIPSAKKEKSYIYSVLKTVTGIFIFCGSPWTCPRTHCAKQAKQNPLREFHFALGIYPPPIAMPETVKVGAGWEAASWGTQVLRPIINIPSAKKEKSYIYSVLKTVTGIFIFCGSPWTCPRTHCAKQAKQNPLREFHFALGIYTWHLKISD